MIQMSSFLLTSLSFFYLASCEKSKPNIIFIIADDMGWNDVSYHGSDQIPTPNIDALAYNGVILNRHYVQPVCSPSRAALMTGKYPIHTGMQGNVILASENRGLSLSETLLPEYLQQLGYSTHLVGKWHLGHSHRSYTPLQRGFSSYLGLLNGYFGHYDHISCCPLFPSWCGYDLRRNDSIAWDLAGKYSTDIFTEEAVSLISSHKKEKPLFLMISHAAPHAGNEGRLLEAPDDEVNKFQHIRDPHRRTYAAMVSKLDQSVGEVVAALQSKDLLKNSIIIFISDNGAPNHGIMRNWGSNYPLRGEKGTLFDGGTRVPALVWSPLIQANSRVADHLMHISDWLPTLLSAAGGHQLVKNKKLDGLDQWGTIVNEHISPRKEILVELDEVQDLNAIIFHQFKYIFGTRQFMLDDRSDQFLNFGSVVEGEEIPEYSLSAITSSKTWNAIRPLSGNSHKDILNDIPLLRIKSNVHCSHQAQLPDCKKYKCLFNLALDPCEQFNLAERYPKFLKFLELYTQFYRYSLVPQQFLKLDQRSNPKYLNYTWSSWL